MFKWLNVPPARGSWLEGLFWSWVNARIWVRRKLFPRSAEQQRKDMDQLLSGNFDE